MNVNKTLLIIPAVLLFVFMVIWVFTGDSLYDQCINEYDYIKTKRYSGIVNSKYSDSLNHNALTIELKTVTGIIKWPISSDQSGLYQFIEVNDSIDKKAGSYSVAVYRFGIPVRVFTLDFNCEYYKRSSRR